MMKWIGFFGGALLLLPLHAMAQTAPNSQKKSGTETMDIATDMLPPPSAEEVVPAHPFFAAPSTGYEVMDKVDELEGRIQKLEARTWQESVKAQPDGTLRIESKGDIEISTPGVVKFKAKSVEMPKAQ